MIGIWKYIQIISSKFTPVLTILKFERWIMGGRCYLELFHGNYESKHGMGLID